MARKRYIKPGFFKNEELAVLPPLVRILFQGLWCWADREGRLEDRPLRIKSEIIPYDKLDVDKSLQLLQKAGFLLRYTVKTSDGINKYIQINKFALHQDVNVKEAVSIIPAPCKDSAKHGADTIPSTVQARVEHGTSTSLNLELRTSTLNLTVVEEEDNAQARKKEIADACELDLSPEAQEERKKVAAKKESGLDGPGCHAEPVEAQPPPEPKPFPTWQEVQKKISQTAMWRNVIEHYLAKEVPNWADMVAEDKDPYYRQREELFEYFYQQKEDNYRIRYPTIAHYTESQATEVAKNFYYWVPKHLQGSAIQNLNNHAISNANTKHNPTNRQRTEDKRNELTDLKGQSTEFLRRSAG